MNPENMSGSELGLLGGFLAGAVAITNNTMNWFDTHSQGVIAIVMVAQGIFFIWGTIRKWRKSDEDG